MFLFRSAFWLVVGFFLVAPHGTDFGAAATALKEQAIGAGVRAGEQLIVEQITGSAQLPDLLATMVSASAELPATDLPSAATVVPRPRPAALS